jgi:hypothetical protein
MKRSEAVKQIEEILRGYWADHIVPEAADQVLATLEARGMLPPLTAEDRMYHADLDVKWKDEND